MAKRLLMSDLMKGEELVARETLGELVNNQAEIDGGEDEGVIFQGHIAEVGAEEEVAVVCPVTLADGKLVPDDADGKNDGIENQHLGSRGEEFEFVAVVEEGGDKYQK